MASWWQRLFRTRKHASIRTKRPQARLGVETLEDRLVPTTFLVNSLLDVANPAAGTTTLRSAILAVNQDTNATPSKPDVIDFAVTGTISLSAGLPGLVNPIDIEGPGAAKLTLLGDGTADSPITVANGDTATIAGLTIDGNQGKSSAGVTVGANAVVTLQSDVIENNGGGAPFGDSSGGIVSINGGSTVTVLLCTITNNTGSGIVNLDGTLNVDSSTIADNTTAFTGGGIFDAGTLLLTRSTVNNNSAGEGGGGVEVAPGSTATIADSTIAGNSASRFGGGIAVFDVDVNSGPSSLQLADSTIANNTVSQRFSTDGGGGLWVDSDDTAFLVDNIVAGNTHTDGQASVGDDVHGTIQNTSSYNLTGNGTALVGITSGSQGNQIGTAAAPINPRLGPLQNNGGPTFTMALLPGSPALDRGGPNSILDPLFSTDQRGLPRVNDLPFLTNAAGGDGRDIGAFEVEGTPTPTVLTVNTLADANPPSGTLSLRQAIEAANGTLALSALPASQVAAGAGYHFIIDLAVTGTLPLELDPAHPHGRRRNRRAGRCQPDPAGRRHR